MKKLVSKVAKFFLMKVDLYWPYLLTRPHSQLTEDGWFRSVKTGAAVDAQGNPVPWMTYPFLEFIRTRLRPEFTVFEYGCGNSSLWFASHVTRLFSVEHVQEWHDKVKKVLPSNSSLIFASLEDGDRYVKACHEPGQTFDIAIVDGRRRVQCAQNVVSVLSPSGVIVWDNTEREEYLPGLKELTDSGFRRIDFWGMSPLNLHKSCTTLLYRTGNCLGV